MPKFKRKGFIVEAKKEINIVGEPCWRVNVIDDYPEHDSDILKIMIVSDQCFKKYYRPVDGDAIDLLKE